MKFIILGLFILSLRADASFSDITFSCAGKTTKLVVQEIDNDIKVVMVAPYSLNTDAKESYDASYEHVIYKFKIEQKNAVAVISDKPFDKEHKDFRKGIISIVDNSKTELYEKIICKKY